MKHTPKDFYYSDYLIWELFHRDEALLLEESRLSSIVDAFGSAGDEVAALIDDLGLVTKDAPVFLFDDEPFERPSFEDSSLEDFYITPSLWLV